MNKCRRAKPRWISSKIWHLAKYLLSLRRGQPFMKSYIEHEQWRIENSPTQSKHHVICTAHLFNVFLRQQGSLAPSTSLVIRLSHLSEELQEIKQILSVITELSQKPNTVTWFSLSSHEFANNSVLVCHYVGYWYVSKCRICLNIQFYA